MISFGINHGFGQFWEIGSLINLNLFIRIYVIMMVSDIEITKESIGNKDFAAVKLRSENEVINYQLQMLVNNKIPGLLSVSRQQTNDIVRLMYDTEDKVSMSELISGNNKISKRYIITLIDTFIRTMNGIREYQLPSKGILIDEEYIFFSKDGSEVSFIYLPLYDDDVTVDEIKPILKKLVINDRIEITHDDFVQRLITVINDSNTSEKTLRNFISYFKGSGKKQGGIRETEPRREQRKNTVPPAAAPVRQIRETVIAEKPAPVIQNQRPEPKQQVKKQKPEKKEGSKNKTIMTAVCAGLVVVLAGGYSAGIFTVDGQLRLDYLGAAALICGLIAFLVGRKLFSSDNTEKKPEQRKQTFNNLPDKGMKMPPKKKDQAVKMPPVSGKSRDVNVSVPKKPPVPTKKPAYSFQERTVVSPVSRAEELEDDTEVMSDMLPAREAYLEYFENGIALKIFIRGGSVLVGKQRSRVDYAIANNKVSKVHAEFGYSNGEYYVKDQKSTNGTYVNGGPRLQPFEAHVIDDGDVIRIADVEMVLHCS